VAEDLDVVMGGGLGERELGKPGSDLTVLQEGLLGFKGSTDQGGVEDGVAKALFSSLLVSVAGLVPLLDSVEGDGSRVEVRAFNGGHRGRQCGRQRD